ncbi:hypothetical protein BAUCODRAFT_124163 [Baudoinia panamericana UAMH 10762]|uniref:Uncharacterized protein n=1 Tax=Baudoinia panamericana (strain UAMH 10762) TaxID=717646 RepID=M2MSR9_BAUPA|nr:uncharacterized protein BAUCODRAFT_124163 [Baudoinia panamericana UAMH 10762]EMC94543.1 hypothetical protein BAUCODRAFT_124163 [Baudoinia panamericana UAMH 10762]
MATSSRLAKNSRRRSRLSASAEIQSILSGRKLPATQSNEVLLTQTPQSDRAMHQGEERRRVHRGRVVRRDSPPDGPESSYSTRPACAQWLKLMHDLQHARLGLGASTERTSPAIVPGAEHVKGAAAVRAGSVKIEPAATSKPAGADAVKAANQVHKAKRESPSRIVLGPSNKQTNDQDNAKTSKLSVALKEAADSC